MKIKEYCECGGQLTGSAKPDSKGLEMQRIFWGIHSGIGHSAVKPSQCYSARRRQELKDMKSVIG